MSKVQCFGCHKYGHYKHQCPELAKKRKEKHHASAANDKVPSKKAKHEETYFFYYSALMGSLEEKMWMIDSGASIHMTGDHVDLSIMKEKRNIS